MRSGPQSIKYFGRGEDTFVKRLREKATVAYLSGTLWGYDFKATAGFINEASARKEVKDLDVEGSITFFIQRPGKIEREYKVSFNGKGETHVEVDRFPSIYEI